jgi:hypothetical protein
MHARDKFYQERKKEMMENPAPTGGKLSVKERLQKKLQDKQNQKVNDDISEFKKLQGQ